MLCKGVSPKDHEQCILLYVLTGTEACLVKLLTIVLYLFYFLSRESRLGFVEIRGVTLMVQYTKKIILSDLASNFSKFSLSFST